MTNEKMYNIKSTKIKRQIPISKMGGISKTLVPGSKEFTIHVRNEYDYRFSSEKYLLITF